MAARLFCTTCIAALLFTQAAVAQQTEPGDLWEVTTEMKMPGMGMSMPARTQKVCSPKNSSEPVGVPKPDDGNCEMYDVKSTGSTMAWKMRCTGKDAMTGSGEMTYKGRESYTGRMIMDMDGESMTTTMSGKRLGDCDAGKVKRDVAAVQAKSDRMVAQQCTEAARGMQVMMFDGSVPMACDATTKADFCKRVSTEEGYDVLAVRGKAPGRDKTDLESAGKICGVDTAAVHDKLCKKALSGKSLVFLARHCPVESAPLARAQCAGRTFTSPPAAEYREFCNAFARHDLMKGAASDAPESSGDEAQDASPPPQEGAIEKSKNTLKKLLPF